MLVSPGYTFLEQQHMERTHSIMRKGEAIRPQGPEDLCVHNMI